MLDISKAFDSIEHQLLLEKLYAAGVRGVPNQWFETYLGNRTQQVKVNDELSETGHVTVGITHESVLSAVLFLVFIHDFCNGKIQARIISFADDTALVYEANDEPDLYSMMQSDMLDINRRFSKNKLSINANKFKLLIFNLRNI